jgi:hypothetical protein
MNPAGGELVTYQRQPYGQDQYRPQQPGAFEPPAQYQSPVQYQPGYGMQQHRAPIGKQYGLQGAEPFWYILGCIAFGAAYFAKIPSRKAACEIVSELQLDGHGPSRGYSLTSAQAFWYVLMCIPFGGAYFAKVSAKKAMWEVVALVQATPGDHTAAIGRALLGPGVPPGA